MNNSQSDLIYKNSWDDMARQLFNAGRIIRSLTKLKYSASTDTSSDFVKKLQKIQFARKFEHLQQKCDYGQKASGEYGDRETVSVTRRDYHSSVRALYHIMECINEVLEKSAPEAKRPQKTGLFLSSDIDNTEMSVGGLNEIEETLSDQSQGIKKKTGTKHKKSLSIPRGPSKP